MADLTKELLLVELHRIIASAAQDSARELGRAAGQQEDRLTVAYPPEDAANPTVTTDESRAIASLALSSDALSAIEKIIADACAATVFHFFCLMDGVADPEVTQVDEWLGASLQAPQEHEQMLHDRFYETYWTFRTKQASLG